MRRFEELPLLAATLAALVLLGLAARWVFRRGGAGPVRASLLAGVAVLLALAGAAVFWVEQVGYGLEGGPSYYAFSPYVRYHRALDGSLAVTALVLYGLAPLGLAVAAGLVRRWRPAMRAALWVAAVAAPALPFAVVAALPRSEYGKDAVFHVETAPSYPLAGGPRPVTSCFEYGVERPDAARPTFGPTPPTLCLHLRPTPTARGLATLKDRGERVSIYDLTDELNRRGFKRYDLPSDLGIEGIQIARAWWRGKQVQSGDPARSGAPPPKTPGAISRRELEAELRRFITSDRRPTDMRGCKVEREGSRVVDAGPPKPRIRVSRSESWLEISYEFDALPKTALCRPYAVTGSVHAGDRTQPDFAISSTRALVTSRRGKVIVDFRPLRGQEPKQAGLIAFSRANWASDEVTVSLR